MDHEVQGYQAVLADIREIAAVEGVGVRVVAFVDSAPGMDLTGRAPHGPAISEAALVLTQLEPEGRDRTE